MGDTGRYALQREDRMGDAPAAWGSPWGAAGRRVAGAHRRDHSRDAAGRYRILHDLKYASCDMFLRTPFNSELFEVVAP